MVYIITMKQPESYAALDQMHVRGKYDKLPVDTARLSAELAAPQDTTRLSTDFDNGMTPLRDVGVMVELQRTAILEAYRDGMVETMSITHPEILTTPVRNLHNRVTLDVQDQPVGHNFFVNASGFLRADLPWARQLDDSLCVHTGLSIDAVARLGNNADKDRFLSDITKNQDIRLSASLAVYLAGRSLEGEKYLKQNYGELLERAKSDDFETIQRIDETTNLRIDMLERAAGQLRRATFGSFDHLQGLVTSDNTGAAGDYLPGTLRVEVQFSGSVRSAQPRGGPEAYRVLVHELHHASAAQCKDRSRSGLRCKGRGVEVTEGMTEYLAQLSIDDSNIRRRSDGGLFVQQDTPYREPVFAMLALHEQFKAGKNNHFAVLFNAYHGDVLDRVQLERALDAFYRYDIAISDQLR